jgi:ABC-type Fe3+/spermidine/putrescine transport system ATPase subunit
LVRWNSQEEMREMTSDLEGQKLAHLAQWQFEHAAMSKMSAVMAERGRQNRAYVRELLWQRQPEFAAALASAGHCLSSRI